MKQTVIKDARLGDLEVEEFVFLGYTAYKDSINTQIPTDKINIDYVKQQLGIAYQQERLKNLLTKGDTDKIKLKEGESGTFNQEYFRQFQELNNQLGVFILNTMTRMYYQSLQLTYADGGKTATISADPQPYTTGRSISDILDQIRPFVPNMQRLFAELLDEQYDKNISVNILQHDLQKDTLEIQHDLGKDLIGQNGEAKQQQISKQ